MTPATSGPELPEPSAYYDPDSSCWRTSGGMFPSASMPSLGTLPPWGMTRGGALYELPSPALLTAGPDCSSSPILPTPVADHSRGLPSSTTDYASLPNVVVSLLPTPAVNDMGAAYTPDEWDAWTDRMRAAHGNGNGHGRSLSIEAQRLLPTPNTMDHLDERSDEALARAKARGGCSNLKDHPLIRGGASTDQPSPDGSAPSDDPHPTPPSPDATDDPDWLPLSWSG